MTRILPLLITCLLISDCSGRKSNTQQAGITQSSKNSAVSFAKGFSLDSQGRNILLTVRNPWQHANGVEFHYILSDTISSSVIIDEYTSMIKTPVKRVICLSTTHIGFIAYLDKIGSISGRGMTID